MATQESIHQGWLYARDGKKFAPMTLIDDVYAMNGKKYKDIVTQQINNVTTMQNTSLTSINQTLGQHADDIEALENADKEILAKLTNFGDDGSDSLYIVDKNNNVIAYIDELGVHSIDFTLPNENGFSLKEFINKDYKDFVDATNTSLSGLATKLANFGDDTGDKFYIIDKYDNVIAYFDETGANSTNFTTPSGNLNQVITDLSQEIKDREALAADVYPKITTNATAISSLSNSVDERLVNFDGTESDALYIIDKHNNVIAYVNETGLHSLNVYSKNFNLDGTNERIRVIEDETIPGLKTTLETADASLKKWVDEERLANFNGDDSSTLYIIDKYNNVIAYVDASGVHSLDFYASTADGVNTTLSAVYKQVVQETQDRMAADATIRNEYQTADSSIRKDFAAADNTVRSEFAAADAKLSEDLTAAYKAADTKLSEDLTEAYKAADALLQKSYESADAGIRQNISANSAQIDSIKKTLSNFDLENGDALYIIDSKDNVIAYFDEQGLTAYNVMFSNARNLVCYGDSPNTVTYNF